MWTLFQLTFVLGNIPMDIIDSFFAQLIDQTKEILGDNQISSIIGDGIIAGVGAVVLFLPNIIILFFGIALLETTGYMSRVAYLLDGFFHKFGLHGKSFIPLITGFGSFFYELRQLVETGFQNSFQLIQNQNSFELTT